MFSDFSYVEKFPGDIKALVQPRLLQLEELKGLEEFQAPMQREIFTGTEPDILVRNYTEGDSLKQIHWKATARAGKLLTRTRVGEEKCRKDRGLYL